MLLFDLDGTLSDPLQGLSRSLDHALTHHGFPTCPPQEVARYVGPPLDLTFIALTGVSNATLIRALVATFRERYLDIGYSENTLYPGIASALKTLQAAGKPMAVCTSKRQDIALKILHMFGLADYFSFVSGGDVGIEKWQQLAELRAQQLIPPDALRIGDRAVDLVAAHRNGLPSAGVLWGYGDRSELIAEQPVHLFNKPADMVAKLSREKPPRRLPRELRQAAG